MDAPLFRRVIAGLAVVGAFALGCRSRSLDPGGSGTLPLDGGGDHPMDLADASLVTAAETLRTTKVFTIDRRDFLAYSARVGRSQRAFTLV
jgi:hypothetical protein